MMQIILFIIDPNKIISCIEVKTFSDLPNVVKSL